ncbi:MAG: TetR/AcrR family transcriptional regulator [Minwuia sp.]|nr:TetR/AcrR family transcriptional regulator [Minwuia sp.]
MREEKQRARHRQIADAAYALLARDGYKATSMLGIAKQAAASNETLYRWYGNKQGLFRALVDDNAEDVRDLLQERMAQGSDPLQTLSEVAPLLLRLVTGERAVALNRAAAADVHDTATLGQTIATAGRDTIVPLIGGLIGRLRQSGALVRGEPPEIAEIFINLLIGDMQIRRVIGVIDPPDIAASEQRAERAISLLVRLYGPETAPQVG